jgi:hypothetical protein
MARTDEGGVPQHAESFEGYRAHLKDILKSVLSSYLDNERFKEDVKKQ